MHTLDVVLKWSSPPPLPPAQKHKRTDTLQHNGKTSGLPSQVSFLVLERISFLCLYWTFKLWVDGKIKVQNRDRRGKKSLRDIEISFSLNEIMERRLG